MNKIIITLCFLSLLLSCSDNDIVNEISSNNKSKTLTRTGGDGMYDVLGFGCDISKDFLYSKLAVIDNTSLEEHYKNAISPNLGQAGSYYYSAGSTASNFLTSISENKEVKIKASFYATATSTISSYYKDTESLSSKYSYASFDRAIQKREYTYSVNIDQLRNCLSENFLYDLDVNFNPQNIIAKYGTHVYTNVKIGGKLTLLYKAAISSTCSEIEKKSTVTAGLSGSIGKIFGGSVDVSTSKEEIEKASKNITNAQFVITAKGGDSSIPMVGLVMDAKDTNYSISIQEWERSVKESTTTVLIDFNPGSLMPIWEFVTDSNKRNVLKEAVENYILGKAISDREALREYYIPWSGNHFCTIHIDDMKSAGYTELGSYGYVYSNEKIGTMPLYIYKSAKNNDHTYSLTRDDAHYTEYGYSYSGIECYVPSVTQIAASEIAPIYYYSKLNTKKSTIDHYYSTIKANEYDGAKFGGTSFYVYKKVL